MARTAKEPGALRAAWEALRDALAELRAELGRAWGYRRASPHPRATGPLPAEPRLRLENFGSSARTAWSAVVSRRDEPKPSKGLQLCANWPRRGRKAGSCETDSTIAVTFVPTRRTA